MDTTITIESTEDASNGSPVPSIKPIALPKIARQYTHQDVKCLLNTFLIHLLEEERKQCIYVSCKFRTVIVTFERERIGIYEMYEIEGKTQDLG